MLVSPEIETAQAFNNAQLASYNELCNHLTGITITGASQAREAITAKLQDSTEPPLWSKQRGRASASRSAYMSNQ